MSLERVLSEAEASREEVVKLCGDLIGFDSAHPEGRTDECVAYIEGYMDRHGVETEVHCRDPKKPNIVARIPGEGEAKILWVGHLDVVPIGKREEWSHPPFGGEVTPEGYIYGRGASDMKGACAAAMVAARLLNELGSRNTVEFWFTADEEIGGGDGARWLAESGRFKGDVCIIGDGTGGGLEHPAIDIGCKGSVPTRLIARGKTAHGSTPFLGENAIKRLMEAIPHVERIAEFRLSLPEELEEPIRESIGFIEATIELTEEQREAVERLYHYPTVSCNIIQGGVKRNVVPDYAEATFDIRLTPGSDPQAVKGRIEMLVREASLPGVEVEVRAPEQAGYYESPNTSFARQLAETVELVTGKRPIFKILTGGTDAINIERYAHIPCLGYGLSMVGEAHKPDEKNRIENLTLGVKVYTLFPLRYGG
ncbi:MAG: Peptidase M20 [Candidatus Bathyarchaeota archaeon B23]|nr:MAG: Peptidase M20 [Candidatus Bathyarchaeota archaeon B23]